MRSEGEGGRETAADPEAGSPAAGHVPAERVATESVVAESVVADVEQPAPDIPAPALGEAADGPYELAGKRIPDSVSEFESIDTIPEHVAPEPPAFPPVVDVDWLEWDAVRAAVAPEALRARMRETVERMEDLLDRAARPGLLFDDQRERHDDRAIRVTVLDDDRSLWFIGDLHGDLLALEAALALIRSTDAGGAPARIVFLGDLFDDGGFGLEVLLRVFELIAEDPGSVCVIAGNHDVALGYDGARFSATVSPSDFADYLNAHLAHEWVVRVGKIAVRLFAAAPRALFFPDGLLVAHGGFPLVDLHPQLLEDGDWNHPACLSDFVWTRAHPKARRKMPNRASRGSQFGYEDFAAFCGVATALGRPVTHLVRGHDHVDDRWALYPAYAAHPVLTTVSLSRQLARESFGPRERVPTIARWVRGSVPQVHRLHIPGMHIREVFPEDTDTGETPE